VVSRLRLVGIVLACVVSVVSRFALLAFIKHSLFPSTFCTGSAGVPCHVGTAMNLQKALVSRWFLGGLLLVSRRSWWCLLVDFGGLLVVSQWCLGLGDALAVFPRCLAIVPRW